MHEVASIVFVRKSFTEYTAIDLVDNVCYQQVRSSALELLGSMYHRLGPPMKALLPELRPALQTQVCLRAMCVLYKHCGARSEVQEEQCALLRHIGALLNPFRTAGVCFWDKTLGTSVLLIACSCERVNPMP